MNGPLVFSPHVICHGFIVYHNLASIVTDYDNLCLVSSLCLCSQFGSVFHQSIIVLSFTPACLSFFENEVPNVG